MARTISINEFFDKKSLYEAVSNLGNKDQTLAENEVDSDHDGYLDYNPELFRKLTSSDFQGLQGILNEKGLISKLRQEKDVTNFFQKVRPAFEAMYGKYLTVWLAGQDGKKGDNKSILDDLSMAMLKNETFASNIAAERFKQGFKFLNVVGKKNLSLLARTKATLGLDIRKCNEGDFSKELTDKFNGYVAGLETGAKPDRYVIRAVSKMINKVHDMELDEHGSDHIREDIAGRLSKKAAYLLIGVGGSALYTSSVITIWRAQRVKDISGWLNEVDADKRFLNDFVRQLSIFGLTDILKKDADHFLAVARDIIMKSEDPSEDAAFLCILYEDIFMFASESAKKNVVRLFLSDISNNDINEETRMAVAFLLKYYNKKLGFDGLVPEAKDIIEGLPPIDVPKIPVEEWLKDGLLTARLFFYEGYATTLRYYMRRGWKIKKASGAETVLSRTLGGVRLEVSLVSLSDTEMMSDTIKKYTAKWDIIAHRGHSYTAENTFHKDSPLLISGKLLFDGSCGSLGNIVDGSFKNAYLGNYFAGDMNVAGGSNNTAFVYRLMETAALGERSWSRLNREFRPTGLILPDSPQLLIWPYVKKGKSLTNHPTDN